MDINSKIRLLSGRKMPVLGLGTWKLSHETAATVTKALLIGYPMIDTSGDYGTQPEVGAGIKHSGIEREKIYVVTKVEEYEDAYESTRKNLVELQLDYADLVLIHRPPEDKVGLKLWKSLIKAKGDGMTKDIGVSNYSEAQITKLIEATGEVPVVNQIEWSPFGYSLEMLRYCRENDIVIQAYSPLTRAERLNDPRLKEIAYKYERSPAQILERWNIQMGIVPIVKANHINHLEEDMDIFDFEIHEDDMAMLNSMNEHFCSWFHAPYIILKTYIANLFREEALRMFESRLPLGSFW